MKYKLLRYVISFCKRSEALSPISQSLAQSNKLDEAQRLFDEAIKIAKTIEDDSNKSECLSKIIVRKLGVKDDFSKMMLQIIVTGTGGNLYEISISSLKNHELWNHIMKQCIGYPEIAYIACAI